MVIPDTRSLPPNRKRFTSVQKLVSPEGTVTRERRRNRLSRVGGHCLGDDQLPNVHNSLRLRFSSSCNLLSTSVTQGRPLKIGMGFRLPLSLVISSNRLWWSGIVSHPWQRASKTMQHQGCTQPRSKTSLSTSTPSKALNGISSIERIIGFRS